ncbi:MAG: hypothetical protein AMS22_06240 [Thiotrichales bacterium SG8_50]|nr:MAG: hypothetical protein AMS22_06240 [Thiotrichales bacterium SG8_50]
MLDCILLPYASFPRSAACYSDAMLIETLVTLRHFNHAVEIGQQRPTIPMAWAGHYQAYSQLRVCCYAEATRRGIPVNSARMAAAKEAAGNGRGIKPHWVGWNKLHAWCKGRLLASGEMETVLKRYLRWRALPLDVRGSDAQEFFSRYFSYGNWTSVGNNTTYLHEELSLLGAPTYYGNHYGQFNWDATGVESQPPLLHTREYGLLC